MKRHWLVKVGNTDNGWFDTMQAAREKAELLLSMPVHYKDAVTICETIACAHLAPTPRVIWETPKGESKEDYVKVDRDAKLPESPYRPMGDVQASPYHQGFIKAINFVRKEGWVKPEIT